FIALGPNGGRGSGNGAAGLGVGYTQRPDTERASAVVVAGLNQISGSFPALVPQEAPGALPHPGNPPHLPPAGSPGPPPALVVAQKYNGIIGDLLVLEQNPSQGASDATLSQAVRVLGLVSRMKEDASEQRAILTAALIQHSLDPAARTALENAQSDQAASLA